MSNLQKTEKDLTIKSIIITLETIIQSSNQSYICNIYTSSKIPNITISDYFIRISKYINCSVECHILALIYIDRLLRYNPNILFNNYTAHRILIICIIIAIKYLEDDIHKNSYYAKIGGLTLNEINKLEIQTLKLLNYNIFVSTNEYKIYDITINNIMNKHYFIN